MTRPLNPAGLALIKSFEECRLTVYADEGGRPTVGWGHLISDDDDLDTGDTITQQEADDLLLDDLQDACDSVCVKVTVPLSDNQYAALVSLTYEAGTGPLIGGLGKVLALRDYSSAAAQFSLWDKVTVDGQLVVSAGLVRRREAESELFLTPDDEPAPNNID
jgi:lysozyme